jgi:hypothetical protein
MPSTPLKVNQQAMFSSYQLYTGFLLGLCFNPEDGGVMFPQNVD